MDTESSPNFIKKIGIFNFYLEKEKFMKAVDISNEITKLREVYINDKKD